MFCYHPARRLKKRRLNELAIRKNKGMYQLLKRLYVNSRGNAIRFKNNSILLISTIESFLVRESFSDRRA